MSFLDWLRGLVNPDNARRSTTVSEQEPKAPSPFGVRDGAGDKYYATMTDMQQAISTRDYRRAAGLALENMDQIPAWVRETQREFGDMPPSIPALEAGGTMLAITGDQRGLERMQLLVAQMPELSGREATVQQHLSDLHHVREILQVVENNPGCRQTAIKTLIGASDGRRPATLIRWLEKHGKIVRRKKGRTYELYSPSDMPEVVSVPTPPTSSHRTDGPKKPHILDLSSLERVALPRAPHRWEDSDRGSPPTANIKSYFQIVDAFDWSLGEIEKLPMKERPDPAFRKMHACGTGLFMIDDLGNAEGSSNAPAAAIHYGRSGDLRAKRPLLHDTYRIQVNPMGTGLAALSRAAVLHVYGASLEPFFQTTLHDAPEMQYGKNRFGAENSNLKNHIRCVALSPENDFYLFTLADMAWVVNIGTGKAQWGLQMPTPEGWRQVSTPASGVATDAEIHAALQLMHLEWPIEEPDVTRRYRELAFEWHPDHNPEDPQADERMKRLNAAVEVLLGTDLTSIVPEAKTYTSAEHETTIDVGGLSFQVSLGVSESFASDWIYAATFASESNSVYLACYSGRVVKVDSRGMPERFFDIGNVPSRIVDTGDYLYILTSTRLYVISGTKLHRLVDVPDKTSLIVAHTGFGLLGAKWLRWFSKAGVPLGCVVAKHPIRRVYWKGSAAVVETRQHRVRVHGMPPWWDPAEPR